LSKPVDHTLSGKADDGVGKFIGCLHSGMICYMNLMFKRDYVMRTLWSLPVTTLTTNYPRSRSLNQSTSQSPLAEQLWNARCNHSTVATDTIPTSVDDAYSVQFVIDSISGSPICGYKIGATSDETMELLGLDEPFFGPLYSTHCRSNRGQVAVSGAHDPKVEAEFVVCLASALGGDGTVDEKQVQDATAWIAGGLEFIGTRFSKPPAKRGLSAIADSGANIDFVLGDTVEDWQQFDFHSHPVTLDINGAPVGKGHSGMSIAGNPFGMVAWLANHKNLPDRGLKPGDIISCGTCTGIAAVQAGDTLVADYGPLGKVNVTVIQT